MGVAFLCPGQGSQAPGAGQPWRGHTAWGLVDEVAEASGVDVARLLCEADGPELVDTANAQLATFTTSLLVADALRSAGVVPVHTAGHSLGEYTALAIAGVIGVAEGARLVAARGAAMRAAAEANPGTMAAIIGLEADVVRATCAEVEGDVWLANDNSPRQCVIAGSAEGVAAAAEALRAAGSRAPMPLKVAGAFHTPYMAPAQEALDAALGEVDFAPSEVAVWANVDADRHDDPAEWAGLLSAQLCSPVRWREQEAAMAAAGVDTVVEVGSGAVLTGMVKRIAPEVDRHTISDPDGIEALAAALV